MRMAGPDIILFVIGALLFAGAGYGLVATGGLDSGATSALGVFNVRFTSATVDLDPQSVPDLGGQREVKFDVTQADVSAVTVTVRCGGTAAALPFTITVNVAGPNGLAGQGNGNCANGATIDIPVTTAPTAAAVQANTEAEAREALPQSANATLAQGSWTITLNGARGGGIPNVAQTNPTGTVGMSLETWQPVFEPVQK